MIKHSARTFFNYTDQEAIQYDTIIEHQIPCYREMHKVIRDSFPYDDELSELHYLELGIGTGNLTQNIIEGHPNIFVDGYDISPRMLEIACDKMQDCQGRIHFHCEDVFDAEFAGSYHAASIFLCENQEYIFDEDFLEKINCALIPKGVFIICCDARIADETTKVNNRILRTNSWEVKVLWKNKPFIIYQFRKK